MRRGTFVPALALRCAVITILVAWTAGEVHASIHSSDFDLISKRIRRALCVLDLKEGDRNGGIAAGPPYLVNGNGVYPDVPGFMPGLHTPLNGSYFSWVRHDRWDGPYSYEYAAMRRENIRAGRPFEVGNALSKNPLSTRFLASINDRGFPRRQIRSRPGDFTLDAVGQNVGPIVPDPPPTLSSLQIPEPSSWIAFAGLAICCGVGLLLRRRNPRKPGRQLP